MPGSIGVRIAVTDHQPSKSELGRAVEARREAVERSARRRAPGVLRDEAQLPPADKEA